MENSKILELKNSYKFIKLHRYFLSIIYLDASYNNHTLLKIKQQAYNVILYCNDVYVFRYILHSFFLLINTFAFIHIKHKLKFEMFLKILKLHVNFQLCSH